ncbi:MAG: hypothetical protein ACLUNQ_00345 [Oscillospiraceae bacterium]
MSGLSTRRFTFEGFLPANKKERRTALLKLQGEERTMVFHEAPHKLRATLSGHGGDPGRPARGPVPGADRSSTRRLCRTTLAGAVALYGEQEPRGEYVLVVAGAQPERRPA